MKIKTPSPKVFALLIVVAILTTATIVSSAFISRKPASISNQKPVDLTIRNELSAEDLSSEDSDGDLLPDWQEEIWKTDKNNFDSDGDGTSDGEEVNQNRNPTVSGPNDELVIEGQFETEIINQSLSKNNTDPDSMTSILSKNLLLRLAQLEQAGQYNAETGSQLAQDLAEQALSEVSIPQKYPSHLFLTFDSNNKERLQQYALDIFNIQYEEGLKVDTSRSDNLDQIITGMKNIASKMSTMPVPADLLETHAKITNNFYIASEALINLKISDQDPLLGILSIPIFSKMMEEQPILFTQMQNYLESSGIIFNDSQNE